MTRIRIAIVGFGKIARDQHVPSLRANPAFELVAVASPGSRLEGLAAYGDIDTLLREVPELSAVALCTPPQGRYEMACLALERGCHVLLEKPPAVTLSEAHSLIELARSRDLCLFASWHSRHAAGVERSREWLVGKRVRQVRVTWKEDVRVWHPGQKWIWKAGGLGVFDPGINALSILTRLLPHTLVLRDAQLSYPGNCETPIAARLQLSSRDGATVGVDLDFLHPGPPCWNIDIETDDGSLGLSLGGSALHIDGAAVELAPGSEYQNLYAHFAELVRTRSVDADLSPLQLVADAFMCGRRNEVADFIG
jgi:D-galactose 1-dehydrogenase